MAGSVPLLSTFRFLLLIDFLAIPSEPDEVVASPAFPLRHFDDQLRFVRLLLISSPSKPYKGRVSSESNEAGGFLGWSFEVLVVCSQESDQVVGGEGQRLGAAEAKEAVASSGGTLESLSEVSGRWLCGV